MSNKKIKSMKNEYDLDYSRAKPNRFAGIVNENTLKFFQETYNMNNELVEIHEKYPVDKGHKKL